MMLAVCIYYICVRFMRERERERERDKRKVREREVRNQDFVYIQLGTES